MKSLKLSIALLGIVLFTSCQNSEKSNNTPEGNLSLNNVQLDGLPESEAENILRKSIANAGGWENWKSKKTLTYTKVIQILIENGDVERELIQLHEYLLKPELKVRISWEENGNNYLIINDGQQAKKYENGEVLEDEESMNSAWNSSFGSHYVICMPFKLTDPGAILEYEGIDTLNNGNVAYAIKTTYKKGVGSSAGKHIWTYYFDKNNYELVGNFLNYGEGYSYTQYEKFDEVDGIKLNTYRKSFKANSINDSIQPTTNYRNENIQFDLEMDEAIFEIK